MKCNHFTAAFYIADSSFSAHFSTEDLGNVNRSVPWAILDGSINIASKSNKSHSFTKWIICLFCGQVKFSLTGAVVHKLAGSPVLLIPFIQQWSHFKRCSAQFWGQVVRLGYLFFQTGRVTISHTSEWCFTFIIHCLPLLPIQCFPTQKDFSCANSSESFLEEFISKDTFSMLIKWGGFGTACDSGSLKMWFERCLCYVCEHSVCQ